MSNRVPHCNECDRCQYTDLFFKDSIVARKMNHSLYLED